jgi:glycosyltransferase involved in cell wall biosynthesis
MEASQPTGPARNLIEFGRAARQPPLGSPPVEVALATFVRGSQIDTPFLSAARRAGLKVYPIHEQGRFDVRVAAQLQQIVNEFHPSIVQSHNVKSHLLVRWLKLYKERPWIAFNHGYTTTNLKDRIYNQCDRWSLLAAHRVVAVCEAFVARLVRRGVRPDQIHIQHNPVWPYVCPCDEAKQALRNELSLDDSSAVLSVGRLSHEKAHRDLITSVALLRERRPDMPFRVIILGDGPERAALAAQRSRLGLEGTVTLVGFKSDPAPYYAVANIMVLPSHSEGSPNAVLEAMSAGVPILATSVGGVPEILENNRTGLMVPPNSPTALATALERLMGDADLRNRLAHAAREHALVAFSPQTYCRNLVKCYEEVLAAWKTKFRASYIQAR